MTNILHLIVKEAWGRRGNFLLSAVATTAAVAICTLLYITEHANRRETRRVMRDIGFNLRVIPATTEMDRFYRTGYSSETLPADSLQRLAKVRNVSYNHLVGVLHGVVEVAGGEVLLMGISSELAPPGAKKPPMIRAVEPGEIQVGAEVARRLELAKGDELAVAGKTFRVARVMPEMGSIDDLRIVGSLADVQDILGRDGQLSEIQAIDCLCMTPAENPRQILQAEIEEVLPDARVVMLSSIAEARARQRRTSDRNAQLVIAAVILAAAAWVAALAVMNVRNRASEIGVLRALGYGSGSIALLVLGRALLIGLVAGAVGAILGIAAAVFYGPDIFEITAKAIRPPWRLLSYAMLATPLFAAAASLVPAALAVTQDPADVLRQG